jgi:hypothetical protein
MSAAPSVSVIVVTKNPGSRLSAALESVWAQRHVTLELIVIDGASTDGTREFLERHRDRIAVLVSEPDAGVYDAMNKGIARATGDWIYFLGGDDRLAGEAHGVGRERLQRCHRRRLAVGARERAGRGHRLHAGGDQVGAGVDGDDARHRDGGAAVDRADAGVRVRRAQHHEVQVAGERHVVDVPAGAGDERGVLDAAHRVAAAVAAGVDVGGGGRSHGSGLGWGQAREPSSAAAAWRTDSTMFT